jgi:hypothetical protein
VEWKYTGFFDKALGNSDIMFRIKVDRDRFTRPGVGPKQNETVRV